VRIFVIINPLASRHARLRVEALSRECPGGCEVEIRHTNRPGHATHIARQALSLGTDMIVAVGGDGTVNEVLNATVRTGVTCGVIPAGSANDLAIQHRIPSDVDRAWATILNHEVRRIDAISVNGWIYVTGGGIGLPCDVVRRVDSLRHEHAFTWLRRLGLRHSVYAGSLVCHILSRRFRSCQVTCRSGNGEHDVSAIGLFVSNQPLIGRHFRPSPQACNCDGRLDVFVIRSVRTRIQILPVIVRAMFGLSSPASPGTESWSAPELLIRSEEPLSFMGDGEVRSPQAEFAVRVLPRAIRLAVPPRQE
jgi:YegS/Rv2252/BmrU family lipid kinase